MPAYCPVLFNALVTDLGLDCSRLQQYENPTEILEDLQG